MSHFNTPASPEYYTASEGRQSLMEESVSEFVKNSQANAAARAKWAACIDPLARQATHRKNDYGTILKLLTALDSNSPLIQNVADAESVPREVGSWFVVKGEERSVVKLGIGANPGLKKYYWRANSSKRLLKREMEDAEAEASLVYIIQKASTVSKRCAAIPGSDVWLVMYLPATLRNESAGPRRAAGPSTSTAASRKRGRAATTVAPAERKAKAAARRAAAVAAAAALAAAVDDDADVDVVNMSSMAGPSSSLGAAGPAGRRASLLNGNSAGPSAKRQCQAGFRATAAPTAVRPSPSRDTVSIHKKGIADQAAATQAAENYPAPVAYDVLAANDDLVSELENSAAFFLDSTFDDDLAVADNASADPFLPLAGSQTIFSAAIEAACMSGQVFPWMHTAEPTRASLPLPQLFTF
jgi:hypothetical protein